MRNIVADVKSRLPFFYRTNIRPNFPILETYSVRLVCAFGTLLADLYGYMTNVIDGVTQHKFECSLPKSIYAPLQ
jgi:hypothetical protein